MNKLIKYIPRSLEPKLAPFLKRPEILAVVGPRRSGKTTFLRHLAEKLSNCAYITFENQVIVDLFDLNIDAFAARYLVPNENLIIDEFQHAKRGGKNLKYLYDTFPKKKIFVSGSLSPDLTIRALRFLTGRALIFTLLPFSFPEFLATKPIRPTDRELESYFAQYITYGGYPEVALEKDPTIKCALLQNIYSLFFSREIKDFTSLSDDYKMKNLLKALSLSTGNLIQYRELTQVSGFDFLSLKRYLNFLDKTYIAFPVFPYFRNRRTELVKNPKLYFYDVGLRNSIIDMFLPFESRPDKGALIENFVAAHLHAQNQDLRFWRTKAKAEVDFVVEKGGSLFAHEVKAGRQDNVPSGLRSFIEKYAPVSASVVNRIKGPTQTLWTTNVSFTPYWYPKPLS